MKSCQCAPSKFAWNMPVTVVVLCTSAMCWGILLPLCSTMPACLLKWSGIDIISMLPSVQRFYVPAASGFGALNRYYFIFGKPIKTSRAMSKDRNRVAEVYSQVRSTYIAHLASCLSLSNCASHPWRTQYHASAFKHGNLAPAILATGCCTPLLY
jgi:hypothetical protein